MNFNKYFALVCGGALMMSASCSNEIEFQQAEQTVTFSVKMPGSTRAASQLGTGMAANTLHCYAYDANNKLVAEAEGTMANKSGNVTITLASKVAYKLVFWADKAQEAGKTIYAFDKENHKVTVNYANMSAQSEDNDAFYNVMDYTGGETTQTVSLTRPLAQINVGTDDSALTVVTTAYNSGVYSNCVIKADSELDLLTGATATPVTLTAPITPMSDLATEEFPVAGASNVKYTGVYYVLAPSTGSTVDMTFNAYKSATDATPCWSVPVPNMPVRRNFRTNVFGSLLTSLTNFSVTITPTFDGSSVATVAEFKKAAQNGGAIIVSKPIDMKGETIVVENGKTLDVNLNGNKISNTAFIVNGSLNIDGDGEISAPTNAVDEPIIKVVEGGNLTLTDGTFEKGVTRSTRSEVKPCVEVLGGTATISGGVYRNEANGVAYTPVKAAGGKLIINGGRFYKADPRNFAEFGASASVLPATAEVYTKDNYYCVLDITKVSTAEELIAAAAIVKEGKFEITVTKDITIRDGASHSGEYTAGLIFNSPNTILNINPGVTLTLGADANGSIANMNSYYGILSPAGKNLTINNNGLIHSNTRGVRAYGNVTINGGNFKAYNPTTAPILWVEEGGSATINNSRFVANFYCIGSCGNVTLNGGYFEGNATNLRKSWAYTVKNDTDAFNARLIINNAEIVGVQGAIGAADGYCEINGGYFHTHRSIPGALDNFYAVSMVESYGAHVVINGGKFYSEAHEANHGSCINWIPWKKGDFIDTESTLEIKGGKFSSKGFYGLNSAWEAKPFVDNYLTPAAGYKWESINEELYKWQVVKDDSAPATASAPKKAKTRAAAPKLYRRLNTGGSR